MQSSMVGAAEGARDGEVVGASVGALDVGDKVGEVDGEAVAATQRLLLSQLSLAQSLSRAQATPTEQPRQSGPPQSTAVSCPFRVLSVQEPAVGDAVVGDTVGAVLVGELVVGELDVGLVVGALEVGLVVGLIEGLSVGLVVGEDVGASTEQVLSERQPPDRQSSFVEQVSPAEQPGQSAPPQSTSVSAPFSLLSVHELAVGETVGLVVGVDVVGVAVGPFVGLEDVGLVVGLAVGANPQAPPLQLELRRPKRVATVGGCS